MSFKLEITKTDELAYGIETRSAILIDALIDKMTDLMRQLQAKAQASVTGSVRDSIRNPRAEYDGHYVVSKLDWGGFDDSYKGGKTFDRAQILESGAAPHVIYPLGEKGTRGHAAKGKGGGRRYGKEVLKFYSQNLGKEVFADYVFHPGVQAKHFMADAIDEMIAPFREGIKETLQEIIDKKGKI